MKTLFIFCIMFMLSCSPAKQQQKIINDNISTIEKNSKPFNPNFNVDTTGKIQAYLTLKVIDGKIDPKPINIEFRASRLQSFQSRKGNYSISLFDIDKKEALKIYIENPLFVRSCDMRDGKVSTTFIKNGTINITIPFNEKINTITLSDELNSTKEFIKTEIDIRKYYQIFLEKGRK